MQHKTVRNSVLFIAAIIIPTIAGQVGFQSSVKASRAVNIGQSVGGDSPNCAKPGVSVIKVVTTQSKSSNDVHDSNINWLEGSQSQAAVEKFWSEMDGDKSSFVGGDVDFSNRKLIYVFDETVDRDRLNFALSDLRKEIQVDLIVGCRLRSELQSTLEELLTVIDKQKITSQYQATIDPLTSSVKISVGELTVADAIQQIELVGGVPIRIEITNQLMKATSRCGDWPAYFGGAVFNPVGACVASCTSGFKVKRNSDGLVGMATVGH